MQALALGLVLLLVGCAPQVRFTSPDPAQPVALSGSLYRPEGLGPFPAMVLLHHCGGLTQNIRNWALWFRSEGYVALAVDSFSPRGATIVCGTRRNPTAREVALDAFGALAHLRSLPFVDPERIGVIGWSYGAMAALQASDKRFLSFVEPRGGGFRAAVAFYPHCSYFPAEPSNPLLLLLGEADDWTPPHGCIIMAEVSKERGGPVVLKVYPGAHHAFDDWVYGLGARQYLGYTLKYDAAARADSETRVRDFLAQYLRRNQP